jgi:3-dehydroquinate dehydratase-2
MIEIPIFKVTSKGLIDKIQELGFTYDGIILNAGAYTHSIAIGDAIKTLTTPVIEWFTSFQGNAKGVILGFGLQSYELALVSFKIITIQKYSK